MVSLFLRAGCKVNGTAQGNSTPLHMAARWGQVDMVRFLLDHGADVDFLDINGETPLHWAVFSRSINLIKSLVEYGANVNVIGKNGETPLDSIYTNDYWKEDQHLSEMVEYLKSLMKPALLH